MRDACHAVVNRGTQWRRYPVNNNGQAARRRERWTRLPECLAGAAYWELWVWRHCVTRLQTCVQLECEPRHCSVAAAGSVICTHWIVCRLSCGRGSDAVPGSDAVRGLFVDWTCHVMWVGILRRPRRWSGWPGGTSLLNTPMLSC